MRFEKCIMCTQNHHTIKILLNAFIAKYFISLNLSYCCWSVAKSCPTLCDLMDCSAPGFLSFTISWSLLKFMSIELVLLPNHFILCQLVLRLPSIFPSIRVFSNELVLCMRWPKYQSFSISPSNEYSGLISFRIGWVFSPWCPKDSQESSPAL